MLNISRSGQFTRPAAHAASFARHGFVEHGLLRDYYAPGIDEVRVIRTAV